ncbi:RNA_pol_Rpb2_6 domain-containing protein [Trichonephila clavipes]|nr:RNA_pol_Rpb2_6 domain-containing protein [Trichonephila clavipes]
MIGSKLDVAIRKYNLIQIDNLETIPDIWDTEFQTADIAITCFLINGTLKQIPFFITNDATNPHIVKNSIVRLYRYDSNEKGQELSFYFDNIDGFNRGALVVRLNDGNHSYDVDNFFDCPYSVDTKTYFKRIFQKGFKIDNLENRIVISPGHLFLKLFTKNLYIPLKNQDYDAIIKKYSVVVKSITNGDLLHIISKKTLFFKETNTKHKMVNVPNGNQQREIGMNDEIYIEKKSTPYRDANCQCYPYLPYISHFTNLQISSKVKSVKVLSYNNSYIGFLCVLGTSETKNVGRVMMLTRNTFVSTQGNLDKIYNFLNIEIGKDAYIVINSACINVTQECFNNIDLMEMKQKFIFVECLKSDNFILINYKPGLLYKQLEPSVWVTSRDIHFWLNKLYKFNSVEQLVELKGYDFITSYNVDIIKYYKHNAFPKNILTLNALKNAVLSTTPIYSLFFCETISAFVIKSPLHQPVLEPANDFSKHFTLYLPKLNLMFASFKGCTQEDSIVLREDLKVFDLYRIYTVKIKFSNFKTDKYFYPVQGQSNPADKMTFLGTITGEKVIIASQTMHLHIVPHGEKSLDLYFTKPNFEIIKWKISSSFLFISIQRFHECSAGDKLCSLHGQKGVLQKHAKLPYAKEIKPDIIINPYCLISRQTMGQLIEAIHSGGKDYNKLYNSDDKPIQGSAFIGGVFYFTILYLSSEHIYAAINCKKDKVIGQAVRGRSRGGGMKYGTMETLNGGIGTGTASATEEIIGEHSDRIILDIPLPQSVVLCNEDANFYKCNIEYNVEPPVYEI